MKKVLFLILLLFSSLVFVTLKDNNNFEKVYIQQETQQVDTKDIEQFYPVEESVWDPGPSIDPDAQVAESGNKSDSEEEKKSKLSLEVGNIFKNTPKDVVTDVYKAMINNDFELFINCNSIQDIEKYAKKKGLTVDQSIEENKQMFEEGSRNMQNLDVKISDYKITQPDDYKSRDHAYVKVHYIGPEKDVEEYIEIPVHREYDKNWYIDQD